MKRRRRKSDTVLVLLLFTGIALLSSKSTVAAGVSLILIFAGILAVLWTNLMRDTYIEEAREEGERIAEERFQEMVDHTEYRVTFKQYVGLGKGYDNDN